jgi:phospholipid/cholesterol/gamma-HCH transport system substrate-binding protein
MNRRPNQVTFLSPLLTGTVVVLIAVIGIFVTYNANKGLPFVPTYKVGFSVPDAGGLAAGREVRIAGKRVGIVDGIRAGKDRRGRPVAVVDAKLDANLKPIRADSVVAVRPLSPLAAKYVELRLGRRGRPLGESDLLPLSQAHPTVELTDAFDVFGPRTRKAIKVVTQELGGGLAGRGVAFNELLDEAPPLVARFERFARTLSDPRTRLDRFIRGGGRTASELGSASRELGSLQAGADTTLGALASARSELADGIAETPATETAGTRALRAARPVLADAQAFLRDAGPGLRVLKPASEQLHLAFAAGIPVLRRATGLADQLADTLEAVRRLSRDPATLPTLRKLRTAVNHSRPTLRFLAPLQTVCNYLGLSTRNFSSTLSEGDQSGTWARFVPVIKPSEAFPSATILPGLHANPYGHTGQNGECEPGNEPYLPGTQIGNPPGRQAGTEDTAPPAEVPGR